LHQKQIETVIRRNEIIVGGSSKYVIGEIREIEKPRHLYICDVEAAKSNGHINFVSPSVDTPVIV